jgi:Flp pilus assembly protein TadG
MPVIKSKRKPARRERGQSLVELAITLPILILLLLGTLDFGMAIFSYSMLRDAAQEGAFYGSFNPVNVEEIENRARNISPRADDAVFSSPVHLRDKDLIKVNVRTLGGACQGAKNGVANSIQVSVSYRYPILMPFVGRLIGSRTIPLTGTASNVILQPPCPSKP